MKKTAIIGCFCLGQEVAEGQSIKTRIVTREIERAIGAEQIRRIDTHNWKKNPFGLFMKSVLAVRKFDHVIMMTDEGGIKVFPWLLRLANAAGKCKLHYVVVGGWLVHFLKKHPFLADCLRRFDGIFVETRVMKRGLEQLGFANVRIMPNCKVLEPLTEDQLVFRREEPWRLCTFSRVMKEKGIEDAVEAVRAVNARFGRTVCTLDIFGQVDAGQTAWFEALSADFPPEIRYGGIVSFDRSVGTIREYHALLFPTRFYTEGIPGTIIDAYAAGVPVVAAEWESFSDMIEPGVTGLGYPFGDGEALKTLLAELVQEPERLLAMKKNCLTRAEDYFPRNVMHTLLAELT